MKRSRMGMALASAGLLGLSTLTAAAPAFADYGKTAVYQVELSANISGQHGGGVWLWLELSNDGSVDYTGSDCGHGLGAAPDHGSTTWSDVNGMLVIPNVVLNGLGGFSATITVPDTLGHYTGTADAFITLPSPPVPPGVGNSQVQVAP